MSIHFTNICHNYVVHIIAASILLYQICFPVAATSDDNTIQYDIVLHVARQTQMVVIDELWTFNDTLYLALKGKLRIVFYK